MEVQSNEYVNGFFNVLKGHFLFSRLCVTCPSSRPPDSTDATVPATLCGNRDARAGTGVERCRTGSRHHQAWPLWLLAGRTDGSRS